MGSRILKVSSKLSHKKDAREFELTKQASSRLSKFSIHKRMNKIISHSINRSEKLKYNLVTRHNTSQRCQTEYNSVKERDIS